MAKKNANNGGSIRQRPDGRWEARVTIGTNPATGKPVRKSLYGATQKEVKQKMTALLSELDKGTYQEPSKMTVSQWFDEWMSTFVEPTLKPTTVEGYSKIIRNHIKPNIGALPLCTVRGTHVQNIFNNMLKSGHSPKTVKNASAVLHKSFSVAVKQGLITQNPCDSTELPKQQRQEIKPLTDAEIPLFLSAIENEEFRNVFAVCLFAGLRRGEVLGLTWDAVDFKRGEIHITQQLQKHKGVGYTIVPYTKSDKSRIVKPPVICFDYLKDEKVKQAQNKLKAGQAWSNINNLVFTDALGNSRAFDTVYSHYKKVATAIGRPDSRLHDLRHTCATTAIACGADVKSVQSMLGHATASFTLNVYCHASEQMKQDTADRMQSYFDNIRVG